MTSKLKRRPKVKNPNPPKAPEYPAHQTMDLPGNQPVYVCTQCWKLSTAIVFCLCVPGKIRPVTREQISRLVERELPIAKPLRTKRTWACILFHPTPVRTAQYRKDEGCSHVKKLVEYEDYHCPKCHATWSQRWTW